MCLAIPGQITQIKGKTATIKYPGNTINKALIADVPVKVGNFVLVQMGLIIKVLTPKEAKTSSAAWQSKTPSVKKP